MPCEGVSTTRSRNVIRTLKCWQTMLNVGMIPTSRAKRGRNRITRGFSAEEHFNFEKRVF